MKALSIMPEWAHLVLLGEKTVEYRTWKTDYRGDLLICASSHEHEGTISKHAICVVTLADIEPFRRKHREGACMTEQFDPDAWAWILTDVRFIEPFPVKGKLHLYEVDDSLIHFVAPADVPRVWNEGYMPLFKHGFMPPRECWFGPVDEVMPWDAKTDPMSLLMGFYNQDFLIGKEVWRSADKHLHDRFEYPRFGLTCFRGSAAEMRAVLMEQNALTADVSAFVQGDVPFGLMLRENFYDAPWFL
jgi:hypothetical protein